MKPLWWTALFAMLSGFVAVLWPDDLFLKATTMTFALGWLGGAAATRAHLHDRIREVRDELRKAFDR